MEPEMCDYTGNNWRHLNVTKRLRKNVEATPVDSLQKTAALGTSHTVREVLQSET